MTSYKGMGGVSVRTSIEYFSTFTLLHLGLDYDMKLVLVGPFILKLRKYQRLRVCCTEVSRSMHKSDRAQGNMEEVGYKRL